MPLSYSSSNETIKKSTKKHFVLNSSSDEEHFSEKTSKINTKNNSVEPKCSSKLASQTNERLANINDTRKNNAPKRLNKIKTVDSFSDSLKANNKNDSLRQNESKLLGKKIGEKFALIQWLSDKMYDIVDVKKFKINSVNSILEGSTYDVVYGAGYLRANVKLLGNKMECEQQLKALRTYDLIDNNTNKKRKINSDDNCTNIDVDDVARDVLEKKNQHLESKLKELELALETEKKKNAKIENELNKTKEIICSLKNTF
ncbi:unnamed protein product, partial [Brachionus calyciflorus]